MPNAILVQTANAVFEALQDAPTGTFATAFDIERSYADWELPLDDEEGGTKPKIDVVPVGTVPTSLETRGSISYQPGADVVVRFRLGPERREQNGKFTLEELDELVLLVEQIAEYFTAARLTGFEDASWRQTEILSAFKPSHLRQFSQFTGIVRITFDTNTPL